MSIPVLICTHDKSSFLWKPLEDNYATYWKNLSGPVYIANNSRREPTRSFRYLNLGSETSWTSHIAKALAKIDAEFVYVTFDDLFLRKNCDFAHVEALVAKYRDEADAIRVEPVPSIYTVFGTSELVEIGHELYRNSVVNLVVRRAALLDLLGGLEEDAWQWDTSDAGRTMHLRIRQTRRKLVNTDNIVIKGRILREYSGSAGTAAPLMTSSQSLLHRMYRARHRIFHFLTPPSLKKVLYDAFKRSRT